MVEILRNFENPLEKGLQFKNFREFLDARRKISGEDLNLLAERFSVPLEKLREVRNLIRERLGLKKNNGNMAIVTTYHLLPWELVYYYLASRRIDLLDYSDYFAVPIGYGRVDTEKPYKFEFGNITLNFARGKNGLIFNIDTSETKTNFQFYQKLRTAFLEFFGKDDNFQGKFSELVYDYFSRENISSDEKLKRILNNLRNLKDSNNNPVLQTKDQIFHISKEDGNDLLIDLLREIFYLLAEFFDFFENRNEQFKIDNQAINPLERDKKVKELLSELIIRDELGQIFEILGISKDNYEQPENYGKLIFLLVILGGLDHIGAEWAEKDESGSIKMGKYNQLRSILGLKILPEIPPGVFVERFSLGSDYPDYLVLKFLFGNLADIIYTASVEGPMTRGKITEGRQEMSGLFSPLSRELREKIRVFDFYLRFKAFIDGINSGNVFLSQTIFRDLVNQYVEKFSKDEEDRKIKIELIDNFFSKRESGEKLDLRSELEELNKECNNLIRMYFFRSLLMEKLFYLYVFQEEVNRNNPNDPRYELLNVFINQTQNVDSLEYLKESRDDFGGISLPMFSVSKLSSDDLMRIYYLQKLVKRSEQKRE
ncbi:MAG: hypothetical protein NZ822_00050 [Patescibacteria group bacterium]|nr:hypothetical protein [Patescibacteria group bacterium]